MKDDTLMKHDTLMKDSLSHEGVDVTQDVTQGIIQDIIGNVVDIIVIIQDIIVIIVDITVDITVGILVIIEVVYNTQIILGRFSFSLVQKEISQKSSLTLVQSSVKPSAAARSGKQWGWKGGFPHLVAKAEMGVRQAQGL